MIVRARIASFEVSVLSTQRGSVWSVRYVEWWIPEARVPSQTTSPSIFEKFIRCGRFLGIFLDFFQKFFGRLARVLRVSRDTGSRRAQTVRDRPSLRSRDGTHAQRSVPKSGNPWTSHGPVPVRVCGFSTGDSRPVCSAPECCPNRARTPLDTSSVDVDVGVV